eukprot:8387710-Pyramimonas_sp.AAC.1
MDDLSLRPKPDTPLTWSPAKPGPNNSRCNLPRARTGIQCARVRSFSASTKSFLLPRMFTDSCFKRRWASSLRPPSARGLGRWLSEQWWAKRRCRCPPGQRAVNASWARASATT